MIRSRRFDPEKLFVAVLCVVCVSLIYNLQRSKKRPITIVPDQNASLAISDTSVKNGSQFVDVRDDYNPYFYGYLINNSHLCFSSGRDVSALVVVQSATEHFPQRRAIRKTWGNATLQRGFKLIFLLGDPSRDDVRRQILAENALHGDVVQGNFVDAYYNLTLKTVTMVHWAARFCPQAHFLLKIDDDFFLNVWEFTSTIRRLGRGPVTNRTIWGFLAKNRPVIRTPIVKWNIPESQYPKKRLPDFVYGGCYLISGDCLDVLYNVSATVPFVQIEDAFMTGLVSEKAGIRRVRDQVFHPQHTDFEPCAGKRIIANHGYSPRNMEVVWHKMASKIPSNQLDCDGDVS